MESNLLCTQTVLFHLSEHFSYPNTPFTRHVQTSTLFQVQFYETRPDVYTLSSAILRDTSRRLHSFQAQFYILHQIFKRCKSSNKSRIATKLRLQ